jgi:hypothetical protein
MARREREILEHAVHTIAEQAVKADELVDEAKAAGGGDHPVTVHAKTLRLELLKVKADLERELEDFVLNCSKCGLDVHWVSGLGVSPGHWAHRARAARRAGCLGEELEPLSSGRPSLSMHPVRPDKGHGRAQRLSLPSIHGLTGARAVPPTSLALHHPVLALAHRTIDPVLGLTHACPSVRRRLA